MTKINIDQWLKTNTKKRVLQSEIAHLEAQVLLGFALNKPREWLVTHPDFELSFEQALQANKLFEDLNSGVPLPYLVGKQAFFGLDFIVTPDVLIPRPETEQLVEETIQWLEEHPLRRKLVDVGTGSGIIAVTLADHFDGLKISAVDISTEALAIAKKNALKFGVDQHIEFLQSDLLQNCPGRFDLIVANLPYIPSETLKSLSVSRHEPLLALDGGQDGLDLINRLFAQSIDKLNPGGAMLLEIEAGQAEAVTRLAEKYWPNAKNTILFDLAKQPRIIKIY